MKHNLSFKSIKLTAILLTASLTLTSSSCITAAAKTTDHHQVQCQESCQSSFGEFSSDSYFGHSFTYFQTGYYQDGYVIDLGYNIQSKNTHYYSSHANIDLSKPEHITVYFSKKASSYANDTKFLSALKSLFLSLNKKRKTQVLRPLILGVYNTKGMNLADAARRLYKKQNLSFFSAIFPQLDESTRNSYCKKFIQDSNLGYLSSCIKLFSKDTLIDNLDLCIKNQDIASLTTLLSRIDKLPQRKVKKLANQCYKKNNMMFFSTFTTYMTKSTQNYFIKKAKKDHRPEFISAIKSNNGWSGSWNDNWDDYWDDYWDNDWNW